MLAAAEIEDEKKNNPPTFNGFTYSDETSDDDDPNEAHYYAGKLAADQFSFFINVEVLPELTPVYQKNSDSDREPKNW